jgi:sensor histidine kinase regulating citrate/malate metabolism
MTLLSFCFRNHSLKSYFHLLSQMDYALFTFVVLADFILSSILFNILIQDGSAYRMVIGVAMFSLMAMSIVLMAIYFNMKKYQQTLIQINEENRQLLLMEVQQYKDLQQKNLDLRAFRHDISYHVTAVQALAAAKDWDGLTAYINKLSGIKEQTYTISVNNLVADAVINYFYEHMPDEADFHVQGKFPAQISIPDTDLCIILSNLLKNAVEAVERIDDCSDKKIYLSIFFDDVSVTVQIENSSDEYEENKPENLTTTKADKINHGFGLKNVDDALKRNGGRMDIQFHDGLFCVCAVIPANYL